MSSLVANMMHPCDSSRGTRVCCSGGGDHFSGNTARFGSLPAEGFRVLLVLLGGHYLPRTLGTGHHRAHP